VRIVDVLGADGEHVLAGLYSHIPTGMFELRDDGVHHVQRDAGAGNLKRSVKSLGCGFNRLDDSKVESVNGFALAAALLIVPSGMMM